MKIQYTGKARVRVEGIGVFEPGEIRAVPEEIGRELRRGAEFREPPSPPTPSPARKSGRGGKVEIDKKAEEKE